MREPYTAKRFLKDLLQGPYAWPGGYPLYFATSDGASLSFASAWAERSQIVSALMNNDTHSGWHVFAMDCNWENPDLQCDHSNKRIESAYADDNADSEPERMPAAYNAWRDRIRGKS